MSNEVITAILTSSIIASLISAVVAYFQFKKNNQLIYITGERQKWREDIRTIAERIEESKTLEDIEKTLVDLKVRINAYGKNSDDIMQDSHIWEIINKLETESDDYENTKKLLILYLSNLLKVDWEKSKEEVRGNGYQIAIYIAVVCAGISFSYSYFALLKLQLNFSFILVMLTMVSPIFIPSRTKMNIDMALKWIDKDNSLMDEFIKIECICLMIFILITVGICFFNNMLNRVDEFFTSLGLLFLAFIIRYLRDYRKYMLNVYYYSNIMLCKQKSRIKTFEDVK